MEGHEAYLLVNEGRSGKMRVFGGVSMIKNRYNRRL